MSSTTINWAEARSEFRRILMMDEGWLVDEGDTLAWWPSPLVTTFTCANDIPVEGNPAVENQLSIHVVTQASECPDERLGLELVAHQNTACQFGAWVWRDGKIEHRVHLALNPLCRELVGMVAQLALAGATAAFQMANWWRDNLALSPVILPHPIGGTRAWDDVDDLLEVYWGETMSLPIEEDLEKSWQVIREPIRIEMQQSGWDLGFTNDEVDFFQREGSAYVGVGHAKGNLPDKKFGFALTVSANSMVKLWPLDNAMANEANLLIAANPRLSLLGPILSVEGSGMEHSSMIGVIPGMFLVRFHDNARGFQVAVMNAATHFAAGWAYLTQVFLGWESDAALENDD